MKPLKLFIFLVLLSKNGVAQSPAVIRQYIDAYKEIAMEEMRRTGVPASITLAQGIHETGAGQSVLVKKSNNHFGIKCKTGWMGESVYHDDDERGECFRKYTDPSDSYKDHSDFLKTRSHYAFLFTLDPTDYEGWAWGLKKAGYATNPKYPQILIRLINEYGLQDYTLMVLGKKEAPAEMWAANTAETGNKTESKNAIAAAPPVAYPQGVFKINETEVVYITKGTPYLLVAEQHRISLARLFDFNDLPQAEVAPADGLLFLHRKRKRGANEFYTVTGKESLHQIAQAEGLRLESLLQYNFLKAGMLPAPGSVLYLQKEAPSMPKLVTAQSTQPVFTAVTYSERSEEDPFIVHTVQPKETVYAIAKRYAVSTDAILKWNRLETPSLKTGQQLRISKKEANGGD
jgi:flagellum-specific peptidoglycan hydrolase FlgJ/LysM repeat protein